MSDIFKTEPDSTKKAFVIQSDMTVREAKKGERGYPTKKQAEEVLARLLEEDFSRVNELGNLSVEELNKRAKAAEERLKQNGNTLKNYRIKT